MAAEQRSNHNATKSVHLVHSNLAEVELSVIAMATIAAAVRGNGLL